MEKMFTHQHTSRFQAGLGSSINRRDVPEFVELWLQNYNQRVIRFSSNGYPFTLEVGRLIQIYSNVDSSPSPALQKKKLYIF